MSRPIERCHEISQCTPIMAEVTAATEHHTYQGMACERGATELTVANYLIIVLGASRFLPDSHRLLISCAYGFGLPRLKRVSLRELPSEKRMAPEFFPR